jgi:serine/threonine-protein kinase
VSEGTVFAVFDPQGSGCLSYGVQTETGERLFVKTSTTPQAAESLKRAVRLHRKVSHPVLVALTEAFMSEDGALTLIYPWCEGRPVREHLGEFHSLPIAVRAGAVGALIDAHLAIAKAGFVAVDLYDGCFLYDFEHHTTRLIDIDEYRPGPFVVEGDRLPGSRRFIAPEELVVAWHQAGLEGDDDQLHPVAQA